MSSDVCTVRSVLDKTTAFRLVSCSESATNTIVTLADTSQEYQTIESIVNERLLSCKHSFRVSSIETARTSRHRSLEFRRRVNYSFSGSQAHLLFHGTKEDNHESIFRNGFDLEQHAGETDKGYIGKGVYLSPFPEYSAAYIRGTSGISRFQYENPVAEGATCKLLGCLTYVGRTRRLYTRDLGSEIEGHLDSRWAWVKSDGNVADRSDPQFAVEYVIKESVSIIPAVRISLQRVQREVVWVDPNIRNSENSGYVRQLKKTPNISLFATTSASRGLHALKMKKDGTIYRAITSGSGGEEFVRKLRGELSVVCEVLVFCMSVDYHKTWACKYRNVKVTNSAEKMKQFATWK